MTGIIDDNGFRLNVGIIIAGQDGRVFGAAAWAIAMPGNSPRRHDAR